MRNAWITACAVLLALSPFAVNAGEGRTNAVFQTRSFVEPKKVDFRNPRREYVTTNAAGWTVYLERELAIEHPALASAATGRLARKLDKVAELLPGSSHAQLRKVPIFLMLGEASKAGGRDNGGEYFQRTAPDHWPLLDPRWRSALVIYSAKNYMDLDSHWSVQVLIHEMAHAWQLEQWPERQPDILAAWHHAEQMGLYRNVRDINGAVIGKAYALANQLEYFAELSCAYFWRGEYAPLDRKALREYDPEGCAMIEKMWGMK